MLPIALASTRVPSSKGHAQALHGHHQHSHAAHVRTARIGRRKLLAMMVQVAQHLGRMLLSGRVAHVETNDRIGQVALLQLVVVGHVGGNLLDQRQQYGLLQRTRIEYGRIISLFERKLNELQVVGDERLVKGGVHVALCQQCPDLRLNLLRAGRRRLGLRAHGTQHRVLDGGRLRIEALADLNEARAQDEKLEFANTD